MRIPSLRSSVRFSILSRILLPIACAALLGATGFAQSVLVPIGATWKYLDDGSNQGTVWREGSFDDNAWKSGPAQLGYGDGDEATRVEDNATPGYVSSDTNRYTTTYFRKAFTVANPAAYQSLLLRLLRDDGAVVYLNGVEVFRSNMPTGTITATTLSPVAVGGTDESAFFETNVSPSRLLTGTNVLAVEIHQQAASSSDISFDLELASASIVTRAPYLQIGTPPHPQSGTCSMTIRWRTSVATDSVVNYGPSPSELTMQVSNPAVTTEHQVTLTGLAADARYYYSVGSSAAVHSGGANHLFFTAPPTGAGHPTRIWVLGDAGTGTANQVAVRDAYYNFANGSYTDVLLMLGDNVYETGTDVEYTTRHFNVYRDLLRQTVSWPTIGNHDTAGSSSPSSTIPYYQSFSLPMSGEAGGLASGTEDYYSFDYGEIHFICLDSMTSSRSTSGPMTTWLRQDLANTLQKWVIAYWHHPPYSKGHDSDTDTIAIEMRSNIVPVLEEYGVDLVLLGHSHAYERSYLIDGHYGGSATFNSGTMVKDGSDGRGIGGYNKPTLGGAGREGAVYVVAGSSGKTQDYPGIVDNGTGNGTGHPAMFLSWERMGSVIIDIDGHRMDVKFLRQNGTIGDTFVITRGPRTNAAPSVTLTTPVTGEQFSENTPITLSAAATDSDQGIKEVVFYANASRIGVVTNASSGDRYHMSYSPPRVGSYTFEARAVDHFGNSTFSASVNITVAAGPPAPDRTAPAAVVNLATSSITTASVALNWTAPGDDQNTGTATSYDVRYSLAPIDETNWNGATQAASEPPPDPAGTAQTMTVSGLVAETQYYFALKSSDEEGNVSPISNVVSAITAVVPPTAPSGLTAAPDPANPSARVNLAWSDNSANEEGFRIERSLDGSSFVELANVLADVTSYVDAYTSPPGRTYHYRISAFRGGAYSPPSNVASATTAPAAPTNLVATPGATQVNIQWTISLGAETYTVYRGILTDGVVNYTVASSGIVGAAFTDTGLTPQTNYFYRVTALNAGGESTPGEVETVTTVPPPATPTGLSASAGDATVGLVWEASSTAASYRIKRASGGGAYVEIAGGVQSTSYLDSPVTNGVTYSYVVVAVNAGGNSADSNVVMATPIAPVPAAPSNLVGTALSRTQIRLSWVDNSNNEDGFRIERSTDGVNFTQVAQLGPNVTSYTNSNLTKNRLYYYRVRAFKGTANSAFSNTVATRTLR